MTPSLFTPLASRLGPEDFLTEALVGVLRRCPEVASSLVGSLVGSSIETVWSVESQVSYGGDRPDIEVLAEGPSGSVVVLIESKVGSSEGWDQLPRYAGLLNKLVVERDAVSGVLVYLTRDHEPKDADDVLVEGVDRSRCVFVQRRWNDVHRHLGGLFEERALDPVSHFLARELVRYLEDTDVTIPNQLTPEMMVGLGHLPKLVRFLDHCLGDEVGGAFKDVSKRSKATTASINALRDHGRFTLAADIGWAWFSTGFSFRGTNEPGWPDLVVDIGVNPKHPGYAEYMVRLGAFAESTPGWVMYEPRPWAGISATKTMREVVGDADQAGVIKAWFLGRLGEVSDLVPAWEG